MKKILLMLLLLSMVATALKQGPMEKNDKRAGVEKSNVVIANDSPAHAPQVRSIESKEK